ncbi:hypothetical protein AB4Z48_26295 [Cupriavidus sp. 2TAF22]|uniref:hypothetical protein n=1 Tax=unclassified Cupriavidus TaxID=2640874 RepID=UPI003F908D55
MALFLSCEMAALALLAREAIWGFGRSAHGWNLAQWLSVSTLAASCAWMLSHWPALWRGAACTYAGLVQGRDATGRAAILVRLPDGAHAVARVRSSWELGRLALLLAMEPVSGKPPGILVISRGSAAPSSLRALKRALGVARREQAAAGGVA